MLTLLGYSFTKLITGHKHERRLAFAMQCGKKAFVVHNAMQLKARRFSNAKLLWSSARNQSQITKCQALIK